MLVTMEMNHGPWAAEDSNETSPEHMAEEFDTAFASYTDARKRFVGMVIMHVDDVLGVGCMDSPRYRSVVEQLKANFSFREWKEDHDSLEYCGCDVEKTPEGGRKIQQMEKVMPIVVDKKRSPADSLREREVAQLRGLLGSSTQWPAVQTSPHLARSTSLLPGMVNKGTVQTLMDTNHLLKFAKISASPTTTLALAKTCGCCASSMRDSPPATVAPLRVDTS